MLASCVTGDDLDRMRSDLHQLRQTSNETRKEVDSLKEKTSGVVREDSFAAIKESQADLFGRINSTSNGLQELRGRFDENRYFTEKALKEFGSEKDLFRVQITGLETQIRTLKDKLAALEMQTKALEQAIAAYEPTEKPSEPVKTEAASAEARAEPPADSRAKAYDAAYQLYRDRRFSEARASFEAFLRDYPKTNLTDNAHFWIAETYYSEKDFESAILAYETLIKKYPDSPKTGGGLLKQGFAFVEIGDAKTGRIILNKLIERYPNTNEAEAAKKKIAELDRNQQKKK